MRHEAGRRGQTLAFHCGHSGDAQGPPALGAGSGGHGKVSVGEGWF